MTLGDEPDREGGGAILRRFVQGQMQTIARM